MNRFLMLPFVSLALSFSIGTLPANASPGAYLLNIPAALSVESSSDVQSLLESEILGYCMSRYADDKPLKSSVLELCPPTPASRLAHEKSHIAAVFAGNLSAKDGNQAVLVLVTVLRELREARGKPSERMAIIKAKRALYSIFAAHPEYTALRFPETKNSKIAGAIAKIVAKFYLTSISNGIVIPVQSRFRDAADFEAGNPIWRTNTEMAEAGPTGIDRWNTHVSNLARIAAKDLDQPSYDFDRANQIVFFEGLKTSATSPKIKITNLNGVSSKMKWGDEVQAEAVVHRLALAAGATYGDLNLVKGPDFTTKRGTILLFDGGTGKELGCAGMVIKTAEQLVECLKISSYKSDIGRYLKAVGRLKDHPEVLDAVQRVAARIEGKHKKQITGEEFFATFREVGIEAGTTKSIVEGGPIAMRGTMSDTLAHKALLLFQMWVLNRDVKEDNGKSILVPDADGRLNYVEYLHDPGMSLGSKTTAGEISQLRNEFISLSADLGGLTYRFHDGILYRPEIFTKNSGEAIRIMAGKILKVTESDIRQILEATNFPEYVKIAWTYKLLMRQNNLSATVKMGNPEPSVRKYAKDYFLSVSLEEHGGNVFLKTTGKFGDEISENVLYPDAILTQEMIERLKTDFQLVVGGAPYTEQVLRAGEMIPPTQTSIQNLLVDVYHPAGLYWRMSRLNDNLSLAERPSYLYAKPTLAETLRYGRDNALNAFVPAGSPTGSSGGLISQMCALVVKGLKGNAGGVSR